MKLSVIKAALSLAFLFIFGSKAGWAEYGSYKNYIEALTEEQRNTNGLKAVVESDNFELLYDEPIAEVSYKARPGVEVDNKMLYVIHTAGYEGISFHNHSQEDLYVLIGIKDKEGVYQLFRSFIKTETTMKLGGLVEARQKKHVANWPRGNVDKVGIFLAQKAQNPASSI